MKPPPPLDGERHRLETALRGGLEEGQTENLLVKVERNIAPQLLRVVSEDLPGRENNEQYQRKYWTTKVKISNKP